MAHNQTNKMNVHMCVLCETIFGAGYFHPMKSCELLKRLDAQSDEEESSEEEESDDSDDDKKSEEESESSNSSSESD
jgi:hypothetical protein